MPATYQRPDSSQNTARRRIAGERRPRDTARAGGRPARRSVGTPRPGRRGNEQPRAHPKPTGEAPGWMRAVAALLLIAVITEAVLLVRGQLEARQQEQRAQALNSALTDAPARAEKAAAALLSYSHTSIDADISKTTPFLTADYSRDYASTMRDVVAGPARQTKATVTAKVLSTAVVDAGSERADVLVFVNQETKSTNHDEPRTALNRAILTMVKRDDAWVVSNLKGL